MKVLRNIRDRQILKFKMSRMRAKELGLLFCTCGHPENNHFDFDSWPCAHCDCKKFKEVGCHGTTLIKEK